MDSVTDKLTTSQLREMVMEKTNVLAERWGRAKQDGPDGPEFDLYKVTEYDGDSAARLDRLRSEQKEIDDLSAKLLVRLQLDKQARNMSMAVDQAHANLNTPVTQAPPSEEMKMGLGDLFVRSQAYTSALGHNSPSVESWKLQAHFPDYDVRNAVVSTGAGWDPPTIRTGRVIDSAQLRLSMVDIIPTYPIQTDNITYMEETTYTATNVVEKAEQASVGTTDVIGEATLAWTQRSEPVQWLPAFIPVTTQQLLYVPGIQERINRRLSRMVRARLSTQLLAGSGTTPNLRGLANRTGIQTQAKGTDDVPTAIHKALAKVRRYEDYNPDAVVLHPDDWGEIATLKTADGVFIWGNPASAQVTTIWGLPVVQASEATAGTGYVGDFDLAELHIRQGIMLTISDSHGYYFTRGQLAIKAEIFAGVVYPAPNAYCSVSGI